jgi:predicted transcriptional regulator of viral defense system
VTPINTTTLALDLLKEKGIARSGDFSRTGVSRTQLRRLCEKGLIERIGHGLYSLPGTVLTENHSLAEASRQVPGGVICLLSALRFHGLTTQNPFEVWMAIDRKAWRPKRSSPKIRYFYLSGPSLNQGIEEHDIGGVPVRVYGAAKTVADCFKFRNKVGLDVAIEAVRDFRRRHPKSLNALWQFAEVDRVTKVIRPYLEALG